MHLAEYKIENLKTPYWEILLFDVDLYTYPDIDSTRTATKILVMENWLTIIDKSWCPNSILVLAEVQCVFGIFWWNCYFSSKTAIEPSASVCRIKDRCSNCKICFQVGRSSCRCLETYHIHFIILQKANHAQCSRLRLRKYKLVRSNSLCKLSKIYSEGYEFDRIAHHLLFHKRCFLPQMLLLL